MNHGPAKAQDSITNQAWLRLKARSKKTRKGFTLLEVILALAILGLALATLGQATGRSHGNARHAADESELAFVAGSVLDELLTGLRPLQAVDGEAIADPTDATRPAIALITVGIESGPLDGLLVLRVRAKPNIEGAGTLETVELVRWMVDPALAESSSTAGGVQ